MAIVLEEGAYYFIKLNGSNKFEPAFWSHGRWSLADRGFAFKMENVSEIYPEKIKIPK